MKLIVALQDVFLVRVIEAIDVDQIETCKDRNNVVRV